MYVEFDRAYGIYRFRYGDVWTDFRGYRGVRTLSQARRIVRAAGCVLRRTDTRVWHIEQTM